jgi:hypothetical protein
MGRAGAVHGTAPIEVSSGQRKVHFPPHPDPTHPPLATRCANHTTAGVPCCGAHGERQSI